jgi:DNA-binding FadR family transcriptional regulator
MLREVIQRERVSEQVSRHLTEQIVTGHWRPGDVLPSERQLARSFQVSIPVVRESIRTLVAKGLVSVRHGVGSFVNPPEQWNNTNSLAILMRHEQSTLLSVHDVRAVFEPVIARLAAEHATDEQLAAVAHALERMRSLVDSPDAACAADLDFHLNLARATGNPMFAVVLQPIAVLMLEAILRSRYVQQAIEHGIQEHQAVFDCVRRHDADGAYAAMLAHMQTTRERLVTSEAAAPAAASASTPS